MIHGLFEEALHLLGVQIHGHKAVRAGQFHTFGAHARADGYARLVFFIALGVGEIGHDQRHRKGVGAFESVHPKKDFHEFVVGVHADRLHEIYVAIANRFIDADKRIAFRKGDYFRIAHLAAQIAAHALGKGLSATARKDGYICAVKHPQHSFACVCNVRGGFARRAANAPCLVNVRLKPFRRSAPPLRAPRREGGKPPHSCGRDSRGRNSFHKWH